MPSIGVKKRTKPRVRILKGFDPMNPSAPSRTERVKTGETILSVQVISLVFNADDSVYEWIRGWDLVNSKGVPYIADSDSADFDVVDAEKLKGWDPRTPAVIQTAFWKTGQTFVEGDELSPDALTGNLRKKVADDGYPVIGRHFGAGPYNIATHASGGALVYGEDSSATDGQVIKFTTGFVTNPTV
jgi:hypothetical protein